VFRRVGLGLPRVPLEHTFQYIRNTAACCAQRTRGRYACLRPPFMGSGAPPRCPWRVFGQFLLGYTNTPARPRPFAAAASRTARVGSRPVDQLSSPGCDRCRVDKRCSSSQTRRFDAEHAQFLQADARPTGEVLTQPCAGGPIELNSHCAKSNGSSVALCSCRRREKTYRSECQSGAAARLARVRAERQVGADPERDG
jgi:hypothetical protein